MFGRRKSNTKSRNTVKTKKPKKGNVKSKSTDKTKLRAKTSKPKKGSLFGSISKPKKPNTRARSYSLRSKRSFQPKHRQAARTDSKKDKAFGVSLTQAQRRAMRGIDLGSCSPSQQKEILGTLKDSFTVDELEMMSSDGGVEVRVGWARGKKGWYSRRQFQSDRAEIVLAADLDPDTITHEFVHHARTVDKSRKGITRTAYPTSGKTLTNRDDISNVEEAATVAETAARTKHPASRPSGYYDDVPNVTNSEAYAHDRRLLTRSPPDADLKDTVGIKGKAAISSVNRNFDRTHIAAKRVQGKTAIESFKKINQK